MDEINDLRIVFEAIYNIAKEAIKECKILSKENEALRNYNNEVSKKYETLTGLISGLETKAEAEKRKQSLYIDEKILLENHIQSIRGDITNNQTCIRELNCRFDQLEKQYQQFAETVSNSIISKMPDYEMLACKVVEILKKEYRLTADVHEPAVVPSSDLPDPSMPDDHPDLSDTTNDIGHENTESSQYQLPRSDDSVVPQDYTRYSQMNEPSNE